KKSPRATSPVGEARAWSRSRTGVLVRKGMTASRIVWRQSPPFADVVYVLAGLVTLVALIGALGALGLGAGLDLSPIGDDYSWIDMLRRGDGADAARLFWAIDHRNPLSPWWYIAARNIILNFDFGLLALRYGMAAVLAISTYYMVLMVAGRQARIFALGLATSV